jgi:hypothetical protein
VKYINHLGNSITNDARYTREDKSRIVMAQAVLNKQAVCTSKRDLKFKEEASKLLYLKYSFVWCWNLSASKSRSDIPGKLWNFVMEKDGVDQ